MKKYVAILSLLGILGFAAPAIAQDATLGTLNPWRFFGSDISPRTTSSNVRVYSFQYSTSSGAGYVLTDVSGNGVASWRPATGGGSGTTTINSVNGPTFFLVPGAGFVIASSSNTFTLTNNGVLSLANGGNIRFSSATGTITAWLDPAIPTSTITTATTTNLNFTTATGTTIWGDPSSGLTVRIPNASSAAGLTFIGASSTSGNNDGGDITFRAGAAAGSGLPGDIIFDPGRFNGTGDKGYILFPDDQDWGSIDFKAQDTSVTDATGMQLNFYGANGNGSGSGGNVGFTSGSGGTTSGAGGLFQFIGGNGGAPNGNGGGFYLSGGTASGVGTGGSLTIQGGGSNTGLGGNVLLKPGGSSAGIASSGLVRVGNASGNDVAAALNSLNILEGDKTFSFPNATGTLVIGSGSSTQVAFWSGSTTVTSTVNFVWDNTNFRLGLGTTTPQTTLQVGTPLNNAYHYLQLDSTSTAPLVADCNATTSLGRMIMLVTSSAPRTRLYLCGYNSSSAPAWASSTFTN